MEVAVQQSSISPLSNVLMTRNVSCGMTYPKSPKGNTIENTNNISVTNQSYHGYYSDLVDDNDIEMEFDCSIGDDDNAIYVDFEEKKC